MITTQALVGIQGLILLAYGVYRYYMFLYARAKDKE
ncbi:hypothetical protein NB688_002850 [Xanthomonas sacchari]|uniref:Uncharacterized protein n=1 Tax=Xanthomonas sacchari TaxID=56458 RepID=A0ABT3DWB9_9XANT|nr:hypothetical protein [Xanthomonas sacchari]MCW0420684.1 hypothetical protein [Xanthomonas sacchari]